MRSSRSGHRFRLLLVPFLASIIAACSSPGGTALRFEVTVPESVRSEALTGRVFIMVSTDETREPRMQVGRTGIPFFGQDVEGATPASRLVVDGTSFGSPLERLADLPAGDYTVQAMVNVYSRFDRADGHTVWMHDDQWEGQNWRRSPGNIYSEPVQMHLDPARGGTVRITADQVVPPIPFPEDTEYVKRFRMQSPMLTAFWGRPIYIGATVLLPEGYDRHPSTYYPTVHQQGHFSTRTPFGFSDPEEAGSGGGRGRGPNSFSQAWVSDGFPRFIAVTWQHPTPYFDDSYAVNSVNVGPYGDALLTELLPEIEKRFRCIPEGWARTLTGGSTGGWETAALQVWNPDTFGGAWAFAPDPLDFRNVEGINIYDDINAFYKIHAWRKVPIGNTRNQIGEIQLTSEQRNHFELANGTRGRSGEQLDIWSAVFGPLGDDGYFQPLFDKMTGEMYPEVADYWREHFDIRHYLEQNWAEVGPKLIGKLHFIAGDMDNFYLNVGVYHLQEFLESTKDPYYAGSFTFGARGGHGWRPYPNEELIRIMADHITKNAPRGRSTMAWKY